MDFLLEHDGEKFDLAVSGTAFEKHPGLRTAVLLSLFLNARSRETTFPPEDPQGSWIGAETEDEWGSRLWELAKKPLTPDQSAVDAEDAIREALAWMREDGVVSEIDTTVEVLMPDRLDIAIVLTEPSGEVQRFAFVWDVVRGV